MPAGFRRHLMGKTLRNGSYCDVALIRFVGWQCNDHRDIFVNQRLNFIQITR